MRYVALGDSHTIGASVSPEERWPNQLVTRLAGGRTPPPIELVANLAVEGATSADLIRDQLPHLNELDPQLVTLLVGVQDVLGSVPANAYAENIGAILDELLGHVPPTGVVVLACPDVTVSPRATELGDPATVSAAIELTNEILREASSGRGMVFVAETFALSREAVEDPTLVSADGLEPSARQYARWVDAIAPVVERLVES